MASRTVAAGRGLTLGCQTRTPGEGLARARVLAGTRGGRRATALRSSVRAQAVTVGEETREEVHGPSKAELLKTAKRPPQLPGRLPFLGNALDFLLEDGKGFTGNAFLQMALKCYEMLGPLVEVSVRGKKIYFLNDPDLIYEVTVKRAQMYYERFIDPGIAILFTFTEQGLKRKERGEDYLTGVVFSNGERWKTQRNVLMQTLMRRDVQTQLKENVCDKAAKFCERWVKAGDKLQQGVRVDCETQRFTADVIGQLTLSYDFNQLLTDFSNQKGKSEYLEHIDRLMQATYRLTMTDPFGLYRWFETKDKRAARYHYAQIADFESKLIEERMKQHEKGIEYQDCLSLLLSARYENGLSLGKDDIRWTVHDMLIAGNDTTASTIAVAMSLLAKHPNIQTAVREEVVSVLGGKPPQPEHLDSFPLLEAVIRECLRLYPAGHVFLRNCSNGPDVLNGYKIEDQSIICSTPFLLHRTAKYWKDPEKFDPGRFLPGGEWGGVGGSTPKGAFLPFGSGTRTCVGANLALLESKASLSAILQKFEFMTMPPGTKGTGIRDDGSLIITYDVVLSFPEGLTLSIRPLPTH